MRYYKKLFIAMLALIAAGGCKKLDLVPTNKFTDLDFWTTSVNVNNALNNNYSLMYNDNLYFFNDDMSDNAYSSSNDPIATGSFNASTPKFIGDWSFYYSGINSCNLFLANIDLNKTLGADVIARMKGEVRFIRAWHYFNLMKWWG
ncbi:MAG TPA: RagB/SusD family nutrient uptake outer membrane protein, partial [Mucilaginibacter sp.]|nr:RagB/SusD family nutrient uptake outer membrane protein [Mucilaginibacter sp.]